MKKMNFYFALLIGAIMSFSACSSDDEMTEEEKEAQQTQELLETITTNFNNITSKKWTLKQFEPSASMLEASKTEDGYVALTIITKAVQALDFNMVLSFTAQGDLFKTNVAINVAEEDLENKLIEYQDAISGFQAGFLYDTEEYYMASLRQVMAAPFAADNAKIEDIVNETTGECILTIKKADFSNLAYDDVFLSQRKLVAGNNDKIYINQDGTLTVETTSTAFGVSKYIYQEVK